MNCGSRSQVQTSVHPLVVEHERNFRDGRDMTPRDGPWARLPRCALRGRFSEFGTRLCATVLTFGPLKSKFVRRWELITLSPVVGRVFAQEGEANGGVVLISNSGHMTMSVDLSSSLGRQRLGTRRASASMPRYAAVGIRRGERAPMANYTRSGPISLAWPGPRRLSLAACGDHLACGGIRTPDAPPCVRDKSMEYMKSQNAVVAVVWAISTRL